MNCILIFVKLLLLNTVHVIEEMHKVINININLYIPIRIKKITSTNCLPDLFTDNLNIVGMVKTC